MSFIPKWQPIRPDGDHRTHISEPTDKFVPWKPNNIIVQIQLYRWVHSLDFQNQTVIAELHGFLFYKFKGITKKDLGTTMVQSTRYNPRKLKGVTINNPTVCSTYMIHNVDDLRYGLEWMICTWLHLAKDTKEPKAILDFLDEMASCDEEDINRLYLEPLGQWWDHLNKQTLSWDWVKIWDMGGYERESEMPAPRAAIRPALRQL